MPLTSESVTEPSDLLVSATVQDETNQTVSGNVVIPAHPSRFYLGIERGDALVEAKKPHTARLVAVSVRGKRIAARGTASRSLRPSASAARIAAASTPARPRANSGGHCCKSSFISGQFSAQPEAVTRPALSQ